MDTGADGDTAAAQGELLIASVDAAAVIAELEERWASTTPPCGLLGDTAEPFHQSSHGREPTPAGVSNPLWDIVRLLPISHLGLRGRPEPDGIYGLISGLFGCSREVLARFFAFAIPSPGDVEFVTGHVGERGVVEIGAGTGYWAWQLSQAGLDVLAYDSNAWTDSGALNPVRHYPVHPGSTEQAARHSDRVLMLCWPDFGTPFAAETLAAYTGDTLISIGEKGGSTADDAFFDALDADWELIASSPAHVNFDGFRSCLDIYRRAALPRRDA